MTDNEMRDMLIDYMGRGFLENITALLRQEPDLGRFIPDMISQENLGVRLGTTALVEELAVERRDVLRHAVAGLIVLLKSDNPTVRGDAASLLGTIGEVSAKGPLKAMLQDVNAAVREVVQVALEEIDRTGR
ncbi:MAG TPA: HEAT repeat domain-containing protein [Nitrospirota bacterium]|nr:HEAT repeat domain-containing protein [Nitrospirota bacterium]